MPNQPLGPTGLLAQSMTLPAGSQSLAMGGMKVRAQGMDGRKKGTRIFNITPAVNGKTVWNLDADGPLNLSAQGTWTLTPLASFNVSVKAWGEGGGAEGRSGYPGAGAFAGGLVSFIAGEALTVGVGQGRGAAGPFGASGGGWVGLLVSASSTAILIAGAGGGEGHSGGVKGGEGGWPNGVTGDTDPVGNDFGGGGGTQSAPGAGGVANGAVNRTNGTAGSGRTGGAGGWGGSGGGGGYFGGGGGGGSDFSGGGGGGGSSFFNPTRVFNALMLSGAGTIPGNALDPARNGAGGPLSGRIILS